MRIPQLAVPDRRHSMRGLSGAWHVLPAFPLSFIPLAARVDSGSGDARMDPVFALGYGRNTVRLGPSHRPPT